MKLFRSGVYTVCVFQDASEKTPGALNFGGGNFIVAEGTCLYKGQCGEEALQEIYRDFTEGEAVLEHLIGHYALIISHEGHLWVFNDYLGLYRIYVDKTQTVFSDSFLAISEAVEEKSISSQEVYEYIFQGAFYGDQTIFNEIDLLDSRSVWQLGPEQVKTPKEYPAFQLTGMRTFGQWLDQVLAAQIAYFEMLKVIFDHRITTALSGGYDTRLIYALAKRVGLNPSLYVYGSDHDPDVNIAKRIAKGERVDLEHVNRQNYPEVEVSEYPALVRQNFHHFDGFGTTGLFDNGSDLDSRVKRSQQFALQLNGGGGEIYRNFWKLPQGSLSVGQFLQSKYDQGDYTACTARFDKRIYLAKLAGKVKNTLSLTEDRLNRQQLEQLYPLWRLKYWMGINNSINNHLGYALTPFAEPRFVIPSYFLPLKFKMEGKFQAALIRQLDEQVARYPSAYGFDFYHPVGLKDRAKMWGKRNVPATFRPYLRSRKMNRLGPRPYYLTQNYLTAVFGQQELAINEFINTQQIKCPEQLSRALTIEFVFREIRGVKTSLWK